MAPLCKLVKRGAVRANDLPLSNDLEAWPDSSVGRAPTYKVRGREFESRSGRLFSRTFTFHIYIYIYICVFVSVSVCLWLRVCVRVFRSWLSRNTALDFVG